MGARVHWDEGRKKWFVRVYEGGRQYKRYVGRDREEAQAVADVINADLDRVSEYSRVVFSPRGKQILKRVLQRAWERIRSRAHADHGVRPLPLHSFRHTWVTMMLRDGQDPQWVAATVGDSLEVLYKHYAHVLPSRNRDLSALRRSPVSPEASAPQPLRAV